MPKRKRDTKKDVSSAVLGNMYLEIAQPIRVEDSVTSADQQNTTIKIVTNKLIHSLIVFIVVKRDTLRENVPITKKDYIERAVLVLDVAQ